jgi:hypothetical protein
LVYEGGEGLKGFSDADRANDAGDRSLVTGYVFTLGGGPVSWQSRKQATIARSSTEAEYMTLGETGKDASWFKGLFKELGIRMDRPVQIGGASQDTEVLELYGDNQGANALARNPLHHPRTLALEKMYIGCVTALLTYGYPRVTVTLPYISPCAYSTWAAALPSDVRYVDQGMRGRRLRSGKGVDPFAFGLPAIWRAEATSAASTS